jgi:probable F420-dependent oxidoreductase
MAKDVTFALSLSQQAARRPDGSFDGEGYADVVAHAEGLGFDHVFSVDHVFIPGYWVKVISDFFIDPFAQLAFLAGRTSRIELVVSCLVVPYRQPFTAAKEAATIDQLSGGRFALGVTPGYLKEEFEAFRLPLEERNEMTNEFVRIMIELWTNDRAAYNGKYYSFEDVNVQPKCYRRPHVPIWVAGSSRNARRRVAEFGDCWNPLGFTVVDDAYQAANADELAGKALPTSGTKPDQLRRGLAEIAEMAQAASRDISHLQVVVYPGAPTQSSLQDRQAARPTSEQMMDWYGQYLDAGATGFVVNTLSTTLEGCRNDLDRFAAETMPQLRSR